jgi:transcriptional regulator with XRE-family HTH domain
MEFGHEQVGVNSRQRLGKELRRIRDLAGMSGRELARRIDFSQSKVSRIEAGVVLPSLPQVRAWVEAVDASEEAREFMFALTEAAHTDVRSWRMELQDRPHLQNEIRGIECDTRTTFVFQMSVVPGLLQTAEYARQVFAMFDAVPYTPEKLAEAVAGRMDRQLLLYDESRDFRFLITEGALRWRPGGPALLAAQLDRISSLSTLSNVSIGLLPFSTRATVPNSHGFIIYESADDDQNDFVNIEMIHGNTDLHHPDDVEVYRRRWTKLEQIAIHGHEARRFLDDLRHEIRERSE